MLSITKFFSQPLGSNLFNPISVGLIFDDFLWGGGAKFAPPLKSALIELEKFKDSFGKLVENQGGCLFLIRTDFRCHDP